MTADRQPDAQGDLTRYPFPRLLFYLYKKQFLGELKLSQPGQFEGNVYFRDGLPVFCDLPFSYDVLGRVLVERGQISETDLYQSLQEMASSHQLQGQVLIQQGALDMGGLIEGLRLQLVRKLNRLFAVLDATFAIYAGDHGHGTRAEEAQVRADPVWVIYHGVRNNFDNSRLEPELAKLQGMAIRLPSAFEDIQPRYGMGEEMEPLLMLLRRGAIPVDRLFGMSNIGPLPTQMLLYTLWVTEALEATPAGSRRPARPSQPLSPVGRGPGPLTQEAAPVRPQARRYETAPEVQSLAAHFTADGAEMVGDEGTIDAIEEAPRETTDGGTPIITSAPVRDSGSARAPELGQEGVYTIPTQRKERAPSAPVQPIARTPSSPGQPIAAVPSSPGGLPAGVDAGAAAQHHQLIRKTHKRIQEENYYQILGVEPKATVEEIRESYFSLAKDFHPDRVSSLGLQDVAKQAEEIFRFINEAHSTLSDRNKRIEYDKELREGSKKQEVHDALAAEFAFQKGLVLLRKKNFPEALTCFQDAFRLNPKEGEHLGYIGWTLFSDPKADRKVLLPKVKEQLLKAIHISPTSATCHYFLGEVYLALGEERRAFTCFDKVLEIKPDHLEATRHMRIIRMRKDKAKKEKGGLFSRFKKK